MRFSPRIYADVRKSGARQLLGTLGVKKEAGVELNHLGVLRSDEVRG